MTETNDVANPQIIENDSTVNDIVEQQSSQEIDNIKQEYLAYVEKLRSERFGINSREEVIESVNTICKVLDLKTVIPRTERQTVNGERQAVIVGGTPIDMVKSQYPGIYPILAERLLELVSKL
jgi:hypothetical protein